MSFKDPETARKYRAEQARQRKKAGKCTSCGANAEGGVQCGDCREKYNVRRRKVRPEQGRLDDEIGVRHVPSP